MRNPEENKTAPQIPRYYLWVKTYVHSDHNIDNEPQALSSQKEVAK